MAGEQRSSTVNENASISQPTTFINDSSVPESTNSPDRKSEFVARKIEEKLSFLFIDENADSNASAITFRSAINIVSGNDPSPNRNKDRINKRKYAIK